MGRWNNQLTPKHLKMRGCVFNIEAADALVLKHQALGIHFSETH